VIAVPLRDSVVSPSRRIRFLSPASVTPLPLSVREVRFLSGARFATPAARGTQLPTPLRCTRTEPAGRIFLVKHRACWRYLRATQNLWQLPFHRGGSPCRCSLRVII
jgi:hypothetical protein